ncbi:hypothetical protein [Streptomyces sp. NBC_01240]|uniref:hypothetical protein n=1 Tax=Streptomyces sp. NBC_01240 TaxID=2903793 RepID=UPI002E163B8F|nr:hypothetical protein OG466_40970 [Streptomyces sp. NBC_01240]
MTTIFKNRREVRRANQRHARLMGVADRLVIGRLADPATPAEVAALAFALHQIRITESEAAEYLNAGLVRRGRKPLSIPAA